MCCPRNYTEDWYASHPEDYPHHPPTFLVQHSTLDENADTCACLNYHESMITHGARSMLMLIPPSLERCMCVGQANDSSSIGSPYRQHCPDFPEICNRSSTNQTCYLGHAREDVESVQRCLMHTQGFSDMVEPLVRFVRNATGVDGKGTAAGKKKREAGRGEPAATGDLPGLWTGR